MDRSPKGRSGHYFILGVPIIARAGRITSCSGAQITTVEFQVRLMKIQANKLFRMIARSAISFALACAVGAVAMAAAGDNTSGGGMSAVPAGVGSGVLQATPNVLPSSGVPLITNNQVGSASSPLSRGGNPANAAGLLGNIALPEADERNEFSDLVTQSLGRALPIFGFNLFRNVPSTFAPVENIPVTPDYTIGPGDELLIRAWGQLDIDYRAIVDRNGNINVPRIGQMNLAGIKYQNVTEFIKGVVSRTFRNFEISVTLGQLRSIQILVVGQARRPGSYTVSSLSTAVNAVFAAGGPSTRGSMRGIQLKRGNKTIAEIDLYSLLVFGDKSKDQQLLPGDILYFPPVGPLVGLSGSVNNPAIFELKGDTSIDQLVQWAGGFTTTATLQAASIERIADRIARTVERFPLDGAGMRKPVRDGDMVSIFSISPRFENVVTLRGNVANPLRYPYTSGMRVRDLIPEREALITPEYYLRRNQLVRPDALPNPAQARVDLRRQTEINWQYAVIERLNPNDLSTALIPFNLGRAVLEGDAGSNLLLYPGDVVTIFSKDDIRVPSENQTKLIRLEGEFANAGIYQIRSGETLRELVSRVGGVAANAYLFGSEFTRESTRLEQQRTLDETIARTEAEIQRATFGRAQGALNPDDLAAVKQQAEAQRTMLERLKQVRATGRIVLSLGEEGALKDLPDIPLEDGDRFYIPSRSSIVQVVGAVFSPGAVVFRSNKRMGDYLAEAGGPTRNADQRSVYILRADGSVLSARQTGFLTSSLEAKLLMPGDSIVVPEEFDKTSLMRNLKDIAQIFYQFGLGASAIKILRN